MTEETTTSLDAALAGENTQPQPEPATQEAPAEPVQDKPKPEEATGGVDKGDGQIKVPLAALHAERDARQKLEHKLESFMTQQQPAQEPDKAPDMFADPEGYAAWQQRQTQAAVSSVAQHFEDRILNMSEAGATSRHGQEAVEKAKEWALAQPASVQAEIRQQADPYEYAVQQHKKVELTSQLADPAMLEKFQAFLKGGEKAQAKPAPPTNTAVDQSVGARNPQWSGPTSLDDIFTN